MSCRSRFSVRGPPHFSFPVANRWGRLLESVLRREMLRVIGVAGDIVDLRVPHTTTAPRVGVPAIYGFENGTFKFAENSKQNG